MTGLIGLARNPSLLAQLDVGGCKAQHQEIEKIRDIGHQGDHQDSAGDNRPRQEGPQQKRTSFSSTSVLPSAWKTVPQFGLVVFCY
jgi:hypothetical protein